MTDRWPESANSSPSVNNRVEGSADGPVIQIGTHVGDVNHYYRDGAHVRRRTDPGSGRASVHGKRDVQVMGGTGTRHGNGSSR